MDKDKFRNKEFRLNEVKKNLIPINEHTYINPDDPLYYEKVLQYIDPKNSEAHYHLGKKYERLGEIDKALYHYQESRYYPSSYRRHAQIALQLLLEKQHRPMEIIPSIRPQKRKTGVFMKSLIVFLLLLNAFLIYFIYELKPSKAFDDSNKGIEVFNFQGDETPEAMETALYHKLLTLIEKDLDETVKVYGILPSGEIVSENEQQTKSAAEWAESAVIVAEYQPNAINPIRIRYLDNILLEDKLYTLKESIVVTNVIRSAILSYIEAYGEAPPSLEALVNNYPNNYLSFIPNEPVTGRNQVYGEWNNQGGWVYDRGAASIEDMLYPNTANHQNQLPYVVEMHIPFAPIEVFVSKKDYALYVVNGPFLVDSKRIGLGKENRTLAGTYTVKDRVIKPLGRKENIFGAAGLGLGGDIAIHGTYNEASIGANLSLGCVRLLNADILDIFPLIPKGTPVVIEENWKNDGLTPIEFQKERLIPANTPQIKETTDTIFDWLG